jgi:hypothetical protein
MFCLKGLTWKRNANVDAEFEEMYGILEQQLSVLLLKVWKFSFLKELNLQCSINCSSPQISSLKPPTRSTQGDKKALQRVFVFLSTNDDVFSFFSVCCVFQQVSDKFL